MTLDTIDEEYLYLVFIDMIAGVVERGDSAPADVTAALEESVGRPPSVDDWRYVLEDALAHLHSVWRAAAWATT